MYEMKTKITDQRVEDFIASIMDEKKRQDAFQLLEIFAEATQWEPKMWGDAMIGYGSYHYKYASGHEGASFTVGFSPRKAKMTLYVVPWHDKGMELFEQLGKHTRSKACVYLNRLSDIDVEVLKQVIVVAVQSVQEMYQQ